MEIFCFFIGVFYFYTFSIYALIALVALLFIKPHYLLLLFFLLGLSVAYIHQEQISPKGMPQTEVIASALIQGSIASIPTQNGNKTQFLLSLEQINQQKCQGLVQLAWYNNAPILRVGQIWRLHVKLKKPRNFLNPGSYDYVTSLTSRHINWTGYVRSNNSQLISEKQSFFSWLILREYLAQQLLKLSPNEQTAGIIEALTLNLTPHISQDDWNLFRRTGTTHLFGISGEHIALLSGLFFWLSRKLWSLSPSLCLKFPATAFASLIGLSAGIFYAFLAGFAPPVQRALIGCLLYTFCCLGKQRFTPWQVWRYALIGVLCLEPHAIFMQGFYFSFLAVACILLTQQRWGLKGYKGNLALQLSCLIGLMPLTLYWFSYGSINGFLANLFAIPLVGFLIVPLALLTMLFSTCDWAWLLMKALAWLIALLFQGLSWTEQLAFINISWCLSDILLVLGFMGALLLWVLLPIKPFGSIALIWLLLPLFPPREKLQLGEALVQVLDVGQGLAVSIRTKYHTLLYDTGDQFFQGNDLGNMVILPFYKVKGIKKIDTIVISHPDKDHRGGLESIESSLTVDKLLVNDPKYYTHGLNCHSYPDWEWDGVWFHFLPIKKHFNDRNNNCCILQVSTAQSSLLLTGDIEQNAEDYLVQTYHNRLKSDVLVVPHHGSKTSSSYRFLLEVKPKYAIASLGLDNRFRFPHAKTLNSLHGLQIPFIRTDQCGMTEIRLPNTGEVQKPLCINKIYNI